MHARQFSALLFFVFSAGCLVGDDLSEGDDVSAQAAGVSSKRGFSGGPCATIKNLTAKFPDYLHYNWGPRSKCDEHLEHYVPMVWGGPSAMAQVAKAAQYVAEKVAAGADGALYVLGPNECDLNSQCNLSPRQVARIWRAMEEQLKTADMDPDLVFTVPSTEGGTEDFHWSVIGMYEHLYGELPLIDRFALHAYFFDADGPDSASGLKSYLSTQIGKFATGSSRPDHNGPCGDAADNNVACTLGSRSTRNNPDGSILESITIDGRYYNFVSGEPLSSNHRALTSVGRYAAGPCSGRSGTGCRFDSRAIVSKENGTTLESITAYGRYYNFTGGAAWGSNGATLVSVPRYAAGPCKGRSGAGCQFDSRTMLQRGGETFESITAYGRYYNFTDGVGWKSNGSLLTSVPRYAAGPCAGRSGADCTFDSRDIRVLLDGTRLESITAYGRHYNYQAGVARDSNAGRLVDVDRYDHTYMYSGGAYAGTRTWVTEFGGNCDQGANDDNMVDFMRSANTWMDAEPEIEQYFWFTASIHQTQAAWIGARHWCQGLTEVGNQNEDLTEWGHEYADVAPCQVGNHSMSHGAGWLETGGIEDRRYTCWDGASSFCDSGAANATEAAQHGDVVGNWRCDLAVSRWVRN